MKTLSLLVCVAVAAAVSPPNLFGQAAPALRGGTREAQNAIANSIARERPRTPDQIEQERQRELADEKLMLKLFGQPLRLWDVPQSRQLVIGHDGGAWSIVPDGKLRAKLVAISPRYVWLEIPQGETQQVRKDLLPADEQVIVWGQAMKALKRNREGIKWPKEAMARPKVWID